MRLPDDGSSAPGNGQAERLRLPPLAGDGMRVFHGPSIWSPRPVIRVGALPGLRSTSPRSAGLGKALLRSL